MQWLYPDKNTVQVTFFSLFRRSARVKDIQYTIVKLSYVSKHYAQIHTTLVNRNHKKYNLTSHHSQKAIIYLHLSYFAPGLAALTLPRMRGLIKPGLAAFTRGKCQGYIDRWSKGRAWVGQARARENRLSEAEATPETEAEAKIKGLRTLHYNEKALA